MTLTVQPFSQPKITMMKSHTAPMARHQQISFGDSELPSHYDMDNAVRDLARDENYKITGENYKEAFSNFFDDVSAKLKSVKDQDILNRANKDMQNKLYDVDTNMKLPKDKFVENMTGFSKQGGLFLKGQLRDMMMDQLLETKGYKKPKWYQVFNSECQPYQWMKSFMKDVCEKFVDKGKLALKQLV